MAPSRDIFDAMVDKLKDIVVATAGETATVDTSQDQSQVIDDDKNSHGSLLDFPHGQSNSDIALHLVLFPVKLLMHFTVPDVRCLDLHGMPTATLGNAFVAGFMCLVWLIISSCAMVASLEILAGKFMI